MTNNTSDERLKSFLKTSIHDGLMSTGRRLVQKGGTQALTARKLSEASGCSVGTIYNQFGNMERFVLEQNMQTLEELSEVLEKILPASSAYENLNRYIDVFVGFVINNSNLWNMLFGYHIQTATNLPKEYLRKLNRIVVLCENQFLEMFEEVGKAERKLAWQVLWLSLFSLSSFLTTQGLDKFSKINKKNICKLLLNTYLAGMASLRKG